MKLLSVVHLGVLLTCGTAIGAVPPNSAENLLNNSSFERVQANGVPADWAITYRLVDASIRSVPSATAADGGKVLRIQRKTPYSEHLYASIATSFPAKAGVRYRISLAARCAKENFVSLVIGQKWDIRYRIIPDTFWKRNLFEFTLTADQITSQGTAPLLFICDDVTADFELDDIQLVPAQHSIDTVGTPLPSSRQIANGVYLAPSGDTPESRENTFTLPADKNHWESMAEFSEKNLKADVALFWDQAQGIAFKIHVRDNVVNALSGAELFRGDSIQMRIEPAGKCRDEVRDDDLEIGFSPTAGKVSTWYWGAERVLTPEEAEITATRTVDGYVLSGVLRWKLFPASMRQQGFFGFNMIVNDSDVAGERERSVAFLADGIHHAKSNRNNILVFNSGRRNLYCRARIDKNYGRAVCDWFAVDNTAPRRTRLRQSIRDARGNLSRLPELQLRAGQLVRYTAEYTLKDIADGTLNITAETEDGRRGTFRAEKADQLQSQLASLKKLRNKLQVLQKKAAAQPASAVATMYERIADLQLARFSQLLQEKFSPEGKMNLMKHCENILIPEMEELLERYETLLAIRETRTLPENWKMVTSRQRMLDNWPTAVMRSDSGKLEERKVYLGGYGHSAAIREEMKDFSDMGANMIHLEIGPSAFFPTPGKQTEFAAPDYKRFQRDIAEIMTVAKQKNLRTMLLLAPHYAPEWWYDRHPEAAGICGFARYEIMHPETRKMVSHHLDTLFSRLRQMPFSDSIFSFCLTNEPNYSGADPKEKASQQRFAAYLKNKFKTVAELNRRSGLAFADFDAASQSAVTEPAMRVLFEKYRQWALLDWHQFIAKETKKYFPDIPIQTKIMVFFTLDPQQLELGVDPELYSELGDINGNDNYFYYTPGGTWIADWGKTTFYHDLQWSFKPAAIVNGENHIMPDGFPGRLPYGHVYTQAFQQYASGVSGLATWIWAPYKFDHPEIIHNNISRRPLALAALGEATFDANRLFNELQSLRRAPAEVALFYSQTAYLWDPKGYSTAIRDVHEQLCFTGRPITFLSEKQLIRDQFGSARLLILTNVKNLDREAWQGIRRFTASGGRVMYTGAMPLRDEFNRALPPLPIPAERLNITPYPGMDIASLEKQIAPNLSAFQLGMTVSYASGMQGIYRRTVSTPQGELTNLVNYNKGIRNIHFQIPRGYKLRELISDQLIDGAYSLKPLSPILIRLEKAEN